MPTSRVAKQVVRSAVRAPGLKAHVPRTGLAKITAAERTLFQRLHAVVNGRVLRGSNTAIYLVDADSGEEIYAVREDALVNPASNVKLVSTAAALDTLGSDWRYDTRVFGPTPDHHGIANGDIYLRGSFDPTLASGHLEALAWQLADRGVTRIDGDVLLGPDPSRDAVARPKIQIKVSGVDAMSPAIAEVFPANDAVVVHVEAATVTRGRSRLAIATEYITNEAGLDQLHVTVSGRVRAGTSRSYWRWMRDRSQFTGHVLRRALIDAGVQVTGTVRELSFADYVRLAGPSYLPVELATHQSRPMSSIIATVNKRSKNRMADRVIMTAGAVAFGGEPSMDKGVRLMRAWLHARAHISRDEIILDTGSGLSYNTRMSVRDVVGVLREATGHPTPELGDRSTDVDDLSQVYQQSLSIAGVDGTLRNRFKRSAVRRHFRAKTGTLLGVIALSGIMESPQGRTLAVSIVTNDHRSGLKRSVKLAHERAIKAIYGYLRN